MADPIPAGPVPIPYPTTLTAEPVKRLGARHGALKLKKLEAALSELEKLHKAIDFNSLVPPVKGPLDHAKVAFVVQSLKVKIQGKVVPVISRLGLMNKAVAEARKDNPGLPPEVGKSLDGILAAARKLEAELKAIDPKPTEAALRKALDKQSQAEARAVEAAARPFLAGVKAFNARPEPDIWRKQAQGTGKTLSAVLLGKEAYKKFGRDLAASLPPDLPAVGPSGWDPKQKKEIVGKVKRSEAIAKAAVAFKP